MRRRVIVYLCCTLLSCSSLGVATTVAKGVLGDAPSLAVDAQVGDRKATLGNSKQVSIEDTEGDIALNTSKNRFNAANSVTIQEGPDWFTMVLLSLGWLLPSPGEVYREVKSWFTKRT